MIALQGFWEYYGGIATEERTNPMSRTATPATIAPTFGQYTTDVVNGWFVITKVGETTKHPMNWIDFKLTKRGAWNAARAQNLPIYIVDSLAGETKELGEVFDPRAFEQAAYVGYVGYGYSMSDGYYAPLKFESWVVHFRASVLNADIPQTEAECLAHNVWNGNDAADYIRPALGEYARRLHAAVSA